MRVVPSSVGALLPFLLSCGLAAAQTPPHGLAAASTLPSGQAAAAPRLAAEKVLQVAGAGWWPQAAVFADGGFVVAWQAAPASPSARPDALHARLFDRTGAPTTPEIEITPPAAYLPTVAPLPGGFVVAWERLNERQRNGIFARVFSRSGRAVGGELTVAESPFQRCCAWVAPTPDGGFVVQWTAGAPPSEGREMEAVTRRRFFDAEGRSLGPAPEDPPESAEGFAQTVALSVAADGTLSAVEADEVSARWSRSDGFFRELRPEPGLWGKVGVGGSFAPNRDFILVWPTGVPGSMEPPLPHRSAILARRFSGRDGTPLGGGPFKVSARQGWEVQPQLAILPGDGFLAIWLDYASEEHLVDGVLFGRWFRADGSPSSGELRLSKPGAGNQDDAAAAVGSRGEVVVVWKQDADPGSGGGIFARLLKPPA